MRQSDCGEISGAGKIENCFSVCNTRLRVNPTTVPLDRGSHAPALAENPAPRYCSLSSDFTDHLSGMAPIQAGFHRQFIPIECRLQFFEKEPYVPSSPKGKKRNADMAITASFRFLIKGIGPS